ncbi:MAG TPA: transcriptional regulator GcvA [Steroidobacteraceae bacterium]|nr:transcriptional regulator GcvA [Steroidobacteraceae bacterium]
MRKTHDVTQATMSRFLPSMSSLRAFEAAARHLSFSRAAEELSLTQSAISRQMRTLETLLRVKLFHRMRQRLTLTEAGIAYLPQVLDCLSRLEAATLELISHQGAGGVLNLAILPTFGTRWLIPRMGSFARAHPHVTVNFSTRAVMFDFATERLDAAIHFGDVGWPGVVSHRLMGEDVVLVCAPSLVRKRLRSLKDLAHHTLLQHTTRPYAWQEWFAAVGVQDINPLKGPRFEHFSMVIQAAVAGLGVAVIPEFLVPRELADGELVMPFVHPVRSAQAYYLVHPEEKRDLPALRAFREWLLAEVSSPVNP